MRIGLLYKVLCIAACVLGCSSAEESTSRISSAASSGCPTNRVLAEQPLAMACEPAAGFSATTLTFDETARYCLYQLDAEQVGAPTRTVAAENFERLSAELEQRRPRKRGNLELSLDCPALFAQQDAASKSTAEFHKALVDHTGQLTLAAFGASPLGNGQVEVDVFDTAAIPYDETCSSDGCGRCANPAPSDTNPHGRVMGRIIGELTCAGGAACTPLVSIKNRLAMPVVEAHADGLRLDYQCGGHIGRLSDLALALKASLSEPAAAQSKRVLNLSLGWSGHEKSVGSRAIYALLRRASCAGMLALAAAGNANGDDRDGPLFPAAWENDAAPSDETCRLLGFPKDVPELVAEAERRLVYAVSALDYQGEPLGSVRENGRSRIEALGMGGVALEPRVPGTFTALLNGSSVATSITSAIAAVIWVMYPQYSQHRVARELYRRGTPLSYAPDFGVGSVATLQRARKASLCAVLPSWARSGCRESSALPDVSFPVLSGPVQTATSCDEPTAACATPGPAELSGPWLGPQPPFPGCPHCALYRSLGRLYVDYPGAAVTHVRVNRPALTTRYQLPSGLDFSSVSLLAVGLESTADAAIYENADWLEADAGEPISATLELYDYATGMVREEPALLFE